MYSPWSIVYWTINQHWSGNCLVLNSQHVNTIVMRFEVYFRCYRYLGRLLNLFNFITIIDHLWHMSDRYLVTRTPDRMLRHWGRMQMYITYMGMFWGKTLWLVVCVLCGLGSWALDPQRGCGALLDPGVEWASHECEQLARDSHYGLKHIWNGPYELSSPSIHHTTHANIFMVENPGNNNKKKSGQGQYHNTDSEIQEPTTPVRQQQGTSQLQVEKVVDLKLANKIRWYREKLKDTPGFPWYKHGSIDIPQKLVEECLKTRTWAGTRRKNKKSK